MLRSDGISIWWKSPGYLDGRRTRFSRRRYSHHHFRPLVMSRRLSRPMGCRYYFLSHHLCILRSQSQRLVFAPRLLGHLFRKIANYFERNPSLNLNHRFKGYYLAVLHFEDFLDFDYYCCVISWNHLRLNLFILIDLLAINWELAGRSRHRLIHLKFRRCSCHFHFKVTNFAFHWSKISRYKI